MAPFHAPCMIGSSMHWLIQQSSHGLSWLPRFVGEFVLWWQHVSFYISLEYSHRVCVSLHSREPELMPSRCTIITLWIALSITNGYLKEGKRFPYSKSTIDWLYTKSEALKALCTGTPSPERIAEHSEASEPRGTQSGRESRPSYDEEDGRSPEPYPSPNSMHSSAVLPPPYQVGMPNTVNFPPQAAQGSMSANPRSNSSANISVAAAPTANPASLNQSGEPGQQRRPNKSNTTAAEPSGSRAGPLNQQGARSELDGGQNFPSNSRRNPVNASSSAYNY